MKIINLHLLLLLLVIFSKNKITLQNCTKNTLGEAFCNEINSANKLKGNISRLIFSKNTRINEDLILKNLLKTVKVIDLRNLLIDCKTIFKLSNNIPISKIYIKKCIPITLEIQCKF